MPVPWPTTPPSAAHRASFSDATPRAWWLDNLPARDLQPPLTEVVETDLCVVGGGFTGLWTALHAKADDPERDVVLLEAETIGFGASGRNGGFLAGSLTHGLENGLSRFADEMQTLERLGRQNLQGLVDDLRRHRIECDLELTGELLPAMAAYQHPWLEAGRRLHERFGYEVEVFPDAESIQAEVASPLFRGGLWIKDSGGLLDPAKLAVGLLAAGARAGVRIHERTRAVSLEEGRNGIEIRAGLGTVRAQRAVLATSAFPPLLRRLRRYVVPVYDYVLVTEPLSPAQLDAIRWRRRQGIGEGANRFHYYRQSADGRILWGGYDAVYRFGGPVRPDLDDDEPTFARLAQNFFTVFPQLEGARFTHRWGGAIDTCSRFSVSSAPRTTAASRTRPGTRGSGSAPRGSEHASPSTSSTAGRAKPRAHDMCGVSPCRFHRSRCAPPSSSSRAIASLLPTAVTVAGAPGSASSIVSDSDSIADRAPGSALARVEVPAALWRKARTGELEAAAASILVTAFEFALVPARHQG